MTEDTKKADEIKPASIIDVENLSCPLPLLRTKKSIAKINSGETLQVKGVLKKIRVDIEGWCERSGHFFLREDETNRCTSFFIKKG